MTSFDGFNCPFIFYKDLGRSKFKFKKLDGQTRESFEKLKRR